MLIETEEVVHMGKTPAQGEKNKSVIGRQQDKLKLKARQDKTSPKDQQDTKRTEEATKVGRSDRSND